MHESLGMCVVREMYDGATEQMLRQSSLSSSGIRFRYIYYMCFFLWLYALCAHATINSCDGNDRVIF